MAPIPLEVHQAALANNMPPDNRGGSITLSVLIDFIVQRTYHELSVLAELLPRKSDMERKMEIYNFAAGTRQLFVRLLALVKWASSASKVDKSAHIMAFLDKQSMLFIETADMLSKMSRETLVQARLPNFHIPAAVEVLTTGTFSRLPLCIRDRIVPTKPITLTEKRLTLQHLNQVIQHRLVTSTLPAQMHNLKIENGRVAFHVENEFEVSLTVMGDGTGIPWRLLDIDILVEDKETGDGKALVHSLQVNYIHQLIQSRLVDNPHPLTELYNCLHFFCQSLQLEVLYSQTLRLARDRLGAFIQTEEYIPGKCLTISYWKELTSHREQTLQREQSSREGHTTELGYRLTVQTDQHCPWRPLQVTHTPSLSGTDSEATDKVIRSEQLSLERLLVHTIYVRTKARLRELRTELEQRLGGDVECSLQGSPSVLSVPILQPCLRSEQLLVTVDTHTGMLLASVPQYDAPLVQEIQHSLNTDRSHFEGLVSELRFWITQRRCEKTLQHLPATPFERLPVLCAHGHPMNRIGRRCTLIRLHKHPNALVVVEYKEKLGSPCEMEYYFNLSVVKPSSIEDDPKDDTVESAIPKAYLRASTFIELDTFVCTHGPFTRVDADSPAERIIGKRKGNAKCESTPKRQKHPAYFLSEVAHVVALCDERIPFATLSHELTKRNISHGGLQVEAGGASLFLPLLQMPPIEGVSASALTAVQRAVLSASIRMQGKGTRMWVAQLVFCRSPIQSLHPREQGLCRPVYFHYEVPAAENADKTVDLLLDDWAQIVHLYALVIDIAEYLKAEKCNLSNIVTVRSYNFSRLVMAYGPKNQATVTVWWSSMDKMCKLSFGGPPVENPHTLVKLQLQMFLNQTRNLAHLGTILHETYQPLLSLGKLPTIPQLGVLQSHPQVPVQTFVLLPQSPTHVRLTYHNLFCLDVHMNGEGLVSVRDGAYSLFDKSSVVEEFTPTQGLKAFLYQYVDENAVLRRRSQSEDDNPPSPITMETGDTPAGGSTGGSALGGVRFHPPHTPGGGSNPHTPASPHTGNLSQSTQPPAFGSSPAASFNLASPSPAPINPSPSSILPHPSPSVPSVGGMIASSPNPLHVPSPGGLQMPTPSPNPSVSTLPMGHSPAGSFLTQQGHPESSSPFPSSQSLASPAAPSPWPASPGMPRPSPRAGQSPMPMHSPQMDQRIGLHSHHLSRVLPERSWAGAIPTVLTHEAFDALCSPSPPPTSPSDMNIPPLGSPASGSAQAHPPLPTSPLERFLGCIYLKKQLQKIIQQEGTMDAIQTSEPGVIQFKSETLLCKVSIVPTHLQTLELKLSPTQEYKDQWSLEELQVLEKFFNTRVATPPYRPSNLIVYCRFLTTPIRILKNFLQIMRLDLNPGLAPQNYHWSVRWCLRVTPHAPPIIPMGTAALLMIRNKILFFLQLTQQGNPPGFEPPSVVVPLIYDMQTNMTQIAEKREPGGQGSVGLAANVAQIIKRFLEFNSQNTECSVWPAVREVLVALPPPMNNEPNQQQGPPMGQQMGIPGGPHPPGPGPHSIQQGQMPPMHTPMAGPQCPPQGQIQNPMANMGPGGPFQPPGMGHPMMP